MHMRLHIQSRDTWATLLGVTTAWRARPMKRDYWPLVQSRIWVLFSISLGKFGDLSAAQVINAILITFFHQTIVKLELSNLVIRKTISNELFLYRLYIAISGARSPLEPYQIYEPEAWTLLGQFIRRGDGASLGVELSAMDSSGIASPVPVCWQTTFRFRFRFRAMWVQCGRGARANFKLQAGP